MELYIEFIEADGFGPSLTTISANKNQSRSKSLITRICGGFISMLQSGYYDVPKTSLGRNSSIFGTNLNFSGLYLSRFKHNPNPDTRARNSINAFDFNFGIRSMS
ncbi:hypothetical protein J1N35_013742 [Gossypium stocksii]|uniref:Uncharacterized protein n=1 Tax=Gossypium stocksii TaxID=47602 RepID=A0A9D3VUE9_9ROSI|nr:hypothetical protein J1N35_013742 [Gossypium stocksii]